jgi:two-component system phosphate regulon response regulator PhoB
VAEILIVEDERDLREILVYNLRQGGHALRTCDSGREALALASRHPPDLVILDLMLPDISGFDVCRALKRAPPTQHCHILMLTARGEEMDRVVGFELGADDYVVKPFSVRELMLRIDSLLRRRGAPLPADAPRLTFLRLRIDLAAHRAFVDEEELALTAMEFKLLTTLLSRRDRVQTREQLLEDVWGITADVTTRTVDTHVRRLREKLGEARDYVQTVRASATASPPSPSEGCGQRTGTKNLPRMACPSSERAKS